MRLTRWFWMALLGASPFACGDDAMPEAHADGGVDGSRRDGGGDGGDGMPPADAATTPADVGSAGAGRRGYVVASQMRGTDSTFVDLRAGFYAIGDRAGFVCRLETSGECSLWVCDNSTTSTTPWLSAGRISVEGERTVVLDPVEGTGAFGGGYEEALSGGPLWSTGGTVHVSASGGDAPGFATDWTAPARVRIDAPAGGDLRAPAAGDLEIAWSPSGRFAISLTGTVSGTTTTFFELLCDFPGLDGRGTVPASLLRQLPNEARYAAGAVDVATVDVGGYHIDLFAIEAAADGDGRLATGTLTFE